MEEYSLEFRATNGFSIRCDITIYRGIQLVIASETGEIMSVTNACSIIATEVVRKYGIAPNRMLFIEHYNDGQRPLPYGESFDLVTFRWDGKRFGNPEWRHLPPAEFHEILNAVNK